MGNEGSMLPGLDLDPKALENTDEWTMHSATSNCSASPTLSVFCGRTGHDHPTSCALENLVKNLRIYRHPNILRYVSSWTNQGQLYMATEGVRPLSGILGNQTVLEICLGLHDILKSLNFLHEKAKCSHNNVCCASIYVTGDGSWKLGGLEFLCRFDELTSDLLQKSRARRYEKAVPPEEESDKGLHPKAIDTFAFGVLVEEVFRKIPDDVQVPGFKEFRDVSRKQLQNSEPSLRPTVSQLLNQPIFNHKFVVIHDFLSELPLKSDLEKASFFRGLVDQLKEFPEALLASQLSSLLLSRLVLLDKTAQEHLLPVILQPQTDLKGRNLFSMSLYQQHIVPRLLLMFSVRDAQIRLLLLEHFEHYCIAFTKEQLRSKVLPELLVGIKDTNDTVVASTLRALALLVPILGAAAVIGGKRARLFTDGRPKQDSCQSKISQAHNGQELNMDHQPTSAADIATCLPLVELPERPSPDGGEDLVSPPQLDEETDNWSDWDLNESQASYGVDEQVEQVEVITSVCNNSVNTAMAGRPLLSAQSSVAVTASKSCLPDITSLDIKNSIVSSKNQSAAEEIDFFQDMEPVISKPMLLHLNEMRETVEPLDNNPLHTSLDVDPTANAFPDSEGWGDNEDWGDISDAELPNT